MSVRGKRASLFRKKPSRPDVFQLHWFETELECRRIAPQSKISLFWRDKTRICNHRMKIVTAVAPFFKARFAKPHRLRRRIGPHVEIQIPFHDKAFVGPVAAEEIT